MKRALIVLLFLVACDVAPQPKTDSNSKVTIRSDSTFSYGHVRLADTTYARCPTRGKVEDTTDFVRLELDVELRLPGRAVLSYKEDTDTLRNNWSHYAVRKSGDTLNVSLTCRPPAPPTQ